MYMEVASVFDFARVAVADETNNTVITFAAETDVVKVHRYHPSRQGMIVAAVAPAPRDPTAPVKRSNFAKVVASPPVVIICAKLFVFRRK